jgi:DNA-directed RNA polymerase specialized sigma24 family protein
MRDVPGGGKVSSRHTGPNGPQSSDDLDRELKRIYSKLLKIASKIIRRQDKAGLFRHRIGVDKTPQAADDAQNANAQSQHVGPPVNDVGDFLHETMKQLLEKFGPCMGWDPARGSLAQYLTGCMKKGWRTVRQQWFREEYIVAADGTVSRIKLLSEQIGYDKDGKPQLLVDTIAATAQDREAPFVAQTPAPSMLDQLTQAVGGDALLADVEPRTREYAILTELDGVKGNKAAKQVGLRPATARKRLSRVRQGHAALDGGAERQGVRDERRPDQRPLRNHPEPPTPVESIIVRNAAGVPIDILEWHPDPALRRRWPLAMWWGTWCAAVLALSAASLPSTPETTEPAPGELAAARILQPHSKTALLTAMLSEASA